MLAALGLMVGCASSPPPWSVSTLPALTLPFEAQADGGQAGAQDALFDFSWVLSGDRQAAPLQVFDDGRRMWLQFSLVQGRPQFFGRSGQDWLALDYAVQGAYVVLDAVWPQLRVRMDGLEALIERQSEEQRLQAQTVEQSGEETVSN